MSTIAIVFLIFSMIILWGGLIVSGIFLNRRPEVDAYPAGGDEPGDE